MILFQNVITQFALSLCYLFYLINFWGVSFLGIKSTLEECCTTEGHPYPIEELCFAIRHIVVHACNLSSLGGEGRKITSVSPA